MNWAFTVPVGGNAKVVLLGLANHAHPDGSNAFPSLDRLATYAHCDRSTARRNTRRLEADGWVKRDGLGPQGQTNWTLAMTDEGFEGVAPAPGEGVAPAPEGVAPAPAKGVAKCHPGVAPAPAGGVAPAPPEPSLVNRPKEEDAYASKKKDGLSDVDAVLVHFAEVMRPRRKEFGEQERAIVRDALKVASVEELCDCITSCERSDFHMKRGAYASHPPGPGRKYNRVSDIFRGRQGTRTTREQVDMFLDRLTSGDAGSVPSEENARVRQAKRSVLTAWEFSGDELLVDQGEEAAVWLAQHGWTVHRDGPNGRPRFDRA